MKSDIRAASQYSLNLIALLLAASPAAAQLTGPAAGTVKALVPGVFSPAIVPQMSGKGVEAWMKLPSMAVFPSVYEVSQNVALDIRTVSSPKGVKGASFSTLSGKGLQQDAALGVEADGEIQAVVRFASGKLQKFSAGIAQDVKMAQDEGSGEETSHLAAQKLLDASGLRSRSDEGAAVVQGKAAHSRSSKPLISGVTFAEGVAQADQALLMESLSRRKTGWMNEIKRTGMELTGPQAPVLRVLSSKPSKYSPAAVLYEAEWKQGAEHGRVNVRVRVKTLAPSLSVIPEPLPSRDKWITLRFIGDPGQKRADELAKAQGLRMITRSGKGVYLVAVSQEGAVVSAARKLAQEGEVLSAVPMELQALPEKQLRLSFNEPASQDEAVQSQGIAALIKGNGLQILDVDYDGVYRVLYEGAVPMRELASRLEKSSLLRYAAPVVMKTAPQDQIVVRFKQSMNDADFRSFRARYGLDVDEALDFGAYRFHARKGSAAESVRLLIKDSRVASAAQVGTLSDETVRSAAKGTASYKGRPWSSTEYNMAVGQAENSLILRGATPEQLQLFNKVCSDAPVKAGGFNPWSGD
ncbi:MAG: hypothetical protein WCU88_08175 [Elusimicrobiota bacterium]|jgi:hypothetical protein